MITESIKQQALGLGFDLVGVTDAGAIEPDHAQMMRSWISQGYCGQMSYMTRNLEKRLTPAELMAGAKSVIVVALNYNEPHQQPRPNTRAARVADYARFEDYHEFMKKGLRRLASHIDAVARQKCRHKICVDTAPLAERSLAKKAGLGFIGKNHMLINPMLGGRLFLGEIITDLELVCDKYLARDCGDCDECVKTCPTGALMPDGQFNANRCINYLTIENKEAIGADFARLIGNRIYGCDQCVGVCPYQKNAPARANKTFKYYPQRSWLELDKALNMTQRQFETLFKDSPIARIGLANLKRNARICLANANRSRCSRQSCSC